MNVLEAPRDNLVCELDRLLGGELPIGAFIQWFNSVEWEDLMDEDSAALRSVWDIQNILYQIESHPEDFDREEARRQLRGIQSNLTPTSVRMIYTIITPVQLLLTGRSTQGRLRYLTERPRELVPPMSSR